MNQPDIPQGMTDAEYTAAEYRNWRAAVMAMTDAQYEALLADFCAQPTTMAIDGRPNRKETIKT